MPATVDELKTILSVAGQASYMGAMMGAASATENLARRTVRAHQEMAAASTVYFDETAQRWRDLNSGQFAKLQGEGLGGTMALLTVIGVGLAAELAVVTMALRQAERAFLATSKAAAEFEDTMAFVQIQSGASAVDMARIKDIALGPELIELGVDALHAADGFKGLAAMGYSVADMQAAMVTITQASVATGGDLTMMTGSLLAIMAQYKYTIAELPTVANAVTAALNKTKFQIEDLMLTMKYAGPIASSMGWSIGETVAVLNALYSVLGNAELTGTGFRGVLNALLAPSSQTATAMEEAGLKIEDLRLHMQDAGDLLSWLQSGTWDTALIMRAFGAEAGNAAAVLLNASVPAIEQTGMAIDTTGNVAKDAETKMGTLKGALAQLEAGFVAIKVKIGEANNVLTQEFVGGVKLAEAAALSYLDRTIARWNAQSQTIKDNRDMQLEVAESIIKVGARMATMALEVSRVLAVQAGFVASLAYDYYILRIAIMEAFLAWEQWTVAGRIYGVSTGFDEQRFQGQMDNVKGTMRDLAGFIDATWDWAFAGGATRAISAVEEAERNMLASVHAQMAVAGIYMPKGGETNSAGRKPAASARQQAAEAAAATQQGMRSELDMRRQIAETQARQAAEAERERMRQAQYMDDSVRRVNEVDRAVQSVIGGRLSELVQAQIGRLTGAGTNSGRALLGTAKMLGMDKFVIELPITWKGKFNEEQKAEVINTLLPALNSALNKVPV